MTVPKLPFLPGNAGTPRTRTRLFGGLLVLVAGVVSLVWPMQGMALPELPGGPPGLTAVCSGNATVYVSAGACNANVTVAPPTVSGAIVTANLDTVLNLEGATDYASLPNPVTDDFTIEFWMKTTQVGGNGSTWWNGAGIVDWNNLGVGHFGISMLGNKLAFGTGYYITVIPNDVTIQSLDSVNSGNWVHVACTREKSSGTMKLYINGVLNSTSTSATSISFNGTDNLLIGRISVINNYFNGSIDDLRIWSKVRNAAEIAADMANTTSSNTSGLRVYYPFDQGTPCGNNAGLVTVNDKASSGGNNTATLNNFALNGCSSNWSNPAGSTAPAYTVVNTFNNTANASGTYPIGSTTVSWTVTGGSETALCSQVITVLDTVVPVLAYSSANYCKGTGQTPLPTATPAGGSFSSSPGLSGALSSNGRVNTTTASPGTYTITYTTGGATCQQSASTTVTIVAPVSAGTNASITLCSSDASVNLVNQLGGTPYPGGTWSPALSGGSWGTFTPGTNSAGTYTYSVTAASPCPTATAAVTVSIPPNAVAGTLGSNVAICPGSDYTAALSGQSGGTISWKMSTNGGSTWTTFGGNTSSVNLTGVTSVTKVTTTSTSGTCAPVSSDTITVTPTDNVAPVIANCPASIVLSDGPDCTAIANWTPPTASDNCSSTTVTRIAGPAPGSAFPLGVTTVTYQAVDASGNTANCSFTVSINLRQRSSFKVPGPFCKTDAVVDLNNYLIPHVSGHGESVTSVVGFSNTGAASAAMGAGAPGNGATFQAGYEAVIKLQNTVPAGQKLIIRWKRTTAGTATLNVGASNVGGGLFTDLGNISTSTGNWKYTSIITTTLTNYVSLRAMPGSEFAVDGVLYDYGSDTGGSWTIAGAPGNMFNPAAYSGNVSVVYAVGAQSTTDQIIVGAPPIAGTLTGGSVCPGGLFTVPLSGQSGGTIAWKASVNGGPWTLFGGNTSSVNLSPVNDVTKVTTTSTTAGCASVSSDTVTVTPQDILPPVISGCPGDISVSGFTDNSIVSWAAPTVSDNCTGATITQTAGPAPGSTFIMGTTPVTYTATDGAGLTVTCSFNVTVSFRDPSDFAAPGPFCSSDPSVDLNAFLLPHIQDHTVSVYSYSGLSAPTGVFGTALYGDSAHFNGGAGANVVLGFSDTIPAGGSVVIRWRSNSTSAKLGVGAALAGAGPFTALDTISTNSTSWIFTVVTTTVPMRFIKLTRVGNPTLWVNAVLYDIGSDAGGGWSGTGVTGNMFDPAGLSGAVDIKYTVGSQSTTHSVFVATLPVGGSLTGGSVCSGNPFTATLTGQSAGTIYWATSIDNGGSWQAQGPVGASFTIPMVNQTTLVKARVSAPPCPAATSNVVTVAPGDNVPPTISCPSNSTQNITSGCTFSVGSYVGSAVVADNCTASSSILVTQSPNPGNLLPLGTHTLFLTATDASGNSQNCSFQITVIDNIAPQISCPANITVNAAAGTCGAVVNYTPPVGTDNCSGVTTARTAGLASGSAFPIGVNTVTYKATDAALNTTSCSFTITVEDHSPPNVNIPTADTLYLDTAGQSLMPDLYALLTGLWDCSGTVFVSQTPDEGTVLTGNLVASIQVADTLANDTTVSINMVVLDTLPPIILCPPTDTAYVPFGDCGLNYVFEQPTYSDNSNVVALVDSFGTHYSGEFFPVGNNYTMQYRVNDPDNNTSTCTSTVIVIKEELPNFSYPAADFCTNAGSVHPDQTGLGSPEYHSTTGLDLDSTTGAVNPANSAPSDYTVYMIYPGACSDTVKAPITILAMPNAGSDGNLAICSGAASVDLINYLGGSPATGGTWTGGAVGTSGAFDPATLPSGHYRYKVDGGICGADTAFVHVTVGSSLFAGNDNSVTVCSNSTNVPLNGYLAGANSGGYWTHNNGPHSGDLHPGADGAGDYVYHLDPANGCSGDSATVTIVYANPVNAGLDAAIAVCSTGAPVNLMPLLGAGITTGGTWLYNFNPTDNMFDPVVDSPGTYTYFVPGPSACGNDQATVTVTLVDAPSAGNDTTVTLCENGTPLNLETMLVNSSGNGTWLNGFNGTYDPATNNPGAYGYRVPGNAQCPADTAYVLITEQPAPNAGTSISLTACSIGSPFPLIDNLGATDPGGVWTDSNGNTFNGLFDPDTSNGAYTFNYTVTGTAPCASAQATVTVTVVSAFDAGADTSVTACSNGTPINLFSALPGADPNGTWDSGTGVYDPITDAPGAFTYTVGGGQCPAVSATVTVFEQAGPYAGNSGQRTVCTTESPFNLATVLSGTPNLTGIWTNGNGLAVNEDFNASQDTSGVYTYTVTGNNACAGVQATATATITVQQQNNAGADTTVWLCSNSAVLDLSTLLNGADSGGGWSNGVNSYDPSTDNPITVQYIANANGQCPTDLANITINEDQVPQAGNSSSLTVCVAQNAFALMDALVGNPDAGGVWTNSMGNTVTAQFAPGSTPDGVYTYTVNGINGCAGLAATATANITVQQQNNAGGDSSFALCETGDSIDLSTLLTNADTGGTWSNIDGIYDPVTDTPGSITYTAHSNTQCQADVANITISEEQAPDAGSGGALLICSNAAATDLGTGLSGTQWTNGVWNGPDGVLPNGLFDPATMPGGVYVYAVPAIALCQDASTVVNVSLTTGPSATWTPPAPMCANAIPVDLTSSVTGAPGGSWSGPGINATAHEFAPQSVVVTGNSSTFTVTYSVTANGCTASADGEITVLQTPVANAGVDSVICGTEFTLNANAPIGTGTWSGNMGATFSNQNASDATVQVPTHGIYHFQWNVVNGTCSATDEVQVIFHLPEELTEVNAGADQVQEVATSAELQGIATGATATWWALVSGAGDLVSPGDLSTGVNNLANGENLFVLGARVGNCPARTDTVMITVRGLFIPTGFSPDSDGVNDRYVVRGLEGMAPASLDVFDRWGSLVYHAANYANTWDGHGDHGEVLPDGTYFGVLKIGDKDSWNGAITIKR
ncbi:MAG: HYR domain-containing protein [Flavobacteriales bacterium]